MKSIIMCGNECLLMSEFLKMYAFINIYKCIAYMHLDIRGKLSWS